jgi:DNA-binding transcriptional LysR family regulator
MIDLRRLRYFVALAEELHFGRAAQRLHLSQPSLTQQVQKLESEVGALLLTRTRRTVALTDAGRAFFERARVVLEEMERAVSSAKASAAGKVGELAIGYAAPADLRIVPRLVPRFREQYPHIRLTLHHLGGARLVEALKDDRVRVAILRAPIDEPGIETITVARERLVAVVPEDHPLAHKRRIRFKDLARLPMIFFPRWLSPKYFDSVAQLCLELGGFTLAPSQDVETSQTALALVAAGMGVSLQPDSIKVLQRSGVKYLDISDSPLCAEMAMAYRTGDRSKVLENFLTLVSSPPHLPTGRGRPLRSPPAGRPS